MKLVFIAGLCIRLHAFLLGLPNKSECMRSSITLFPCYYVQHGS